MVTAYDVAERAGVSMGTVSRYLTGNGYVGDASRAKIAAAIDELGYIPNRAAASLTTKNTGLLGFVVSDLRNPFTAEIASSLSQHAREHGYGLVLSDSMNDPAISLEAIESMRAHGVDGLIVTPPESSALNDALVAAAPTLPIVGIGLRTTPQVTDLVTSGTRAGAISAVEHLVGLGHRRIGYVGSSSMASGRYRGYQDALAAAGLPIDPDLVVVGELNRAGGFAAVDALFALAERPTAIFAANDAVALGVIQAAHEWGVAVPEHLSVVGYDDVDLAAHSVPPLTTVAQPLAAMGQAAVELLISRLRGADRQRASEEVVLPVRLVVRGSTASPLQTSPTKRKGNK
jgi:LacI family transcriptional regulator